MDAAEIDALAMAWQRGEREAFTALVLSLQGELRLSVSSFSDSQELVEEILQATFVTCFHKIGLYQPRGTFLAWLKTIARNHLIDHWRERRRCASIEGDLAEQLLADAGLTDLDEDEQERASARSRRLRSCLEHLAPRARQLIERRHLDSRPLGELARQFKQSMGSLSVTLHRIRQSLRRCMDAEP